MPLFKTKIVRSTSFDPWFNLALEEHLLYQCQEEEVILYLWQNDQTVVIGRNQNAWKECRCQQLEADGGKLARRLSGGGAVFHDLGNLNFTFVLDKKHYDLHRQLEIILQAVRTQGIDARFSGRNDLTVDDRKFSGNAFYHTNQVSYHHGTILVDSDFSKLAQYLQVSQAKIAAKGISSVRSRVVNLKEFNQAISISAIQQALKESFIDSYGGSTEEIVLSESTCDLAGLYAKYASWEWRYGKTPDFDLSLQHRFPWGEVDLGLTLQNGIITSAIIYSDAMDSLLIQQVAQSLNGVPLNASAIKNCLEVLPFQGDDASLVREISDWLGEKISQV